MGLFIYTLCALTNTQKIIYGSGIGWKEIEVKVKVDLASGVRVQGIWGAYPEKQKPVRDGLIMS